MTDTAGPTSYDEVPYPSAPMAQTHPDRLATLATLFGMRPPPVERCRMLELACADAGNLLALAEDLPESEFVGIDLSARHIADGQATRRALGLKNVTLHKLSITDVTAELGRFDYVVAHGVYSWVPAPVRDKILAICRDQLAPDGVAFVSYNTYPGWHARGAVRDMMRYHVRAAAGPEERTTRARDLLAFLIESVPGGQEAYRQMLKEEQDRINPCRDWYVYHEHLEDVNEPVYFHEFAARAGAHGLQFVAEADLTTLATGRFTPAVRATLARLGPDVVAREQYQDFLSNRMFRQSLLCHRAVGLCREPGPEVVANFHVASRGRFVSATPEIHTERVEDFRGPNGVLASTGHAISKMAFLHLAHVWPRSVPFDELQVTARARLGGEASVIQEPAAYARDTRLLAESLLQAFYGGVVEFHRYPLRVATEAGERPRTRALSRLLARDSPRVANVRQEMVQLDPLSRYLVRLLDGSRTRAALVEDLVRAAAKGEVPVERYGRPVTDEDRLRAILSRELEPNLRRLARSALLVE